VDQGGLLLDPAELARLAKESLVKIQCRPHAY
jgi:hypothetical protein